MVYAMTSRSSAQRARTRSKTQRPRRRTPIAKPAAVTPFGPGLVCQPKLTVGVPKDRFEQEADRVADRVMRMPEPVAQGPINSGAPAAEGIQRKCSECEEEVRRQPLEEEEEELQMKRAPGAAPEIGPGLQARIGGLRGGGQPLPPSIRGFFEPRFGYDFRQVRVHTNGTSADLARSINARAFTVGQGIVFGAGAYQPNAPEGRRLIAHELVHTLQQAGSVSEFRKAPGAAPRRIQRDADGESIEPAELKSHRFQNDPILDLVRRNLKTLKNGSRGFQTNKAVKKIQLALIDAGFPLPKFGPDGLFGSETEGAVKAFQKFKRLPKEDRDGKVGPVTLGLLDEHFSTGAAPRPLPKDVLTTGISFKVSDAKASYVDTTGLSLRTADGRIQSFGPFYESSAKVTAKTADPKKAAQWDVGHVQDLVNYTPRGIYSNGSIIEFQSTFPIRDSIRGAQLFPWYNPGTVRKIEKDKGVAAAHDDSPDVLLPEKFRGESLVRVEMPFEGLDWVTVRNRNTGETRFLHRIKWGFTVVKVPDESTPGFLKNESAVLTPDPPEETPNPASKASMTEQTFNEVAKEVVK